MATSSNIISTLEVTNAIESLTVEKTRALMFRLGVPVNILDDIETQYNGDNRKQHFIQKWLEIDTSASWEKIVSALQQINMNVLAAGIESMYITKANVLVPKPSQSVNTPAHLEAAPLPVTPTPATVKPPTLHLIQFTAVSKERVTKVKASIEFFGEEFADLNVDAQLALSEKENQDSSFLKRFRGHLLHMPVSKKSVHVKFFARNKNDMLETKNIEALFAILSPYCNYSNYEIIFHIIKKFCETALKTRMLSYRDSLENFEMATTVDVYLCAISAHPKSKIFKGFAQMVLKINKSIYVCTLHEIRRLKEAIASNASLHSYSMYIENPEEGSVSVGLCFPRGCGWWVACVMTAEFRETHHLTEVTIDGYDITSHEFMNNELYVASESGDIEAVMSLITAGADINHQDQYGYTALMWASQNGMTEVITELVKAGSALDLQDEYGKTALIIAAMFNKTEVAALLIESGANIDLQDNKSLGYSALMWAAREGNTEIVAQLVKSKSLLDLQDPYGHTALMVASRKGKTEIVDQLINAGATLDLQDDFGDTALMKASSNGMTEVVTQLVKAGSSLDLQNKTGATPLILATVGHHTDTVRELVRAGADPNIHNIEGLTILIISSRSGRTSLIDILLSANNININVQSSNGWSSLHYSADNGDVDTTQALLKAGADPQLKDQDGLTALDVAAASDHDRVCELLRRHMRGGSVGRRITQGLRNLVKKSSERAKQAFIQLEVRVFRPDIKKSQLPEETSVRGHKMRSISSEDDEIKEEYLSRLNY